MHCHPIHYRNFLKAFLLLKLTGQTIWLVAEESPLVQGKHCVTSLSHTYGDPLNVEFLSLSAVLYIYIKRFQKRNLDDVGMVQ